MTMKTRLPRSRALRTTQLTLTVMACVALFACGGSDSDDGAAINPLQLDQSYGTQGQAVLPLGASDARVNVARLQPDGKLLLAGLRPLPGPRGTGFSPREAVIWRLNGDGSPDTSFGTNGEVALEFLGSDHVSDVQVDNEQRLIVAVSSSEPCDHYPNIGGTCVVPIGAIAAFYDTGEPLNIVTAKSATFVTRLEPDGRLDSSFGKAGAVEEPIAFSWAPPALALQPDHRIVLLRSWAAPRFKLWGSNLIRFTENGLTDTSFNHGQPTSSQCNALGEALQLLPDGRIIVGGAQDVYYSNPQAGLGICVEGYRANGEPDAGLANGQPLWLDAATNASLVGMHRTAAGQPVITGRTTDDKVCSFSAHRLKSSGTPDEAFGNNGSARVAVANKEEGCFVTSSLLSPTGEVAMVGRQWTASNPAASPVWVKLNAQGLPDRRFGDNGIVRGAAGEAVPEHIVRDSTGHWLVIHTAQRADGQAQAVIERRMGDAR